MFKTIQLSQSVCFDLFLEDSKGRISTKMSSFFLVVKQSLLFCKLGKTYCLLRKNYLAKKKKKKKKKKKIKKKKKRKKRKSMS